MQLDWRKEAKDIRDWDLQYSVRIEIEGEHILTTRVDFRVHENDGSPRRNQRIRNAGLQDQEKLIEAVWLKNHLEYSYVVVK